MDESPNDPKQYISVEARISEQEEDAYRLSFNHRVRLGRISFSPNRPGDQHPITSIHF